MSAPASTPELVELAPAERFFRALAGGRLELPFCTRCENLVWYPRARCPVCMATVTRWVEVSGRGTIYSFTVNRRPPRGSGTAPPVIAYIELDEGPRILAQIVGAPKNAVLIGAAVRLAPSNAAETRLAFRLCSTVETTQDSSEVKSDLDLQP
jgi:uncharacterized OB-fold protein